MDDAAVFFTSGGGESIETVVKLVRRYWSLLDQPERTVIISRERAYHGLAGYGTSIVGTEAFKVGVGPLAGDTARVAVGLGRGARGDDPSSSARSAWRRSSASRSSAPAASCSRPTATSRRRARSAATHGVLFVADEVICGYGRVGDWFASSRFGLDPDAVTFAKGITSGYVPLGGVIVGSTIQEPFWEHGRRGRLAPRLHVLGPRDGGRRRAREPRHHRARRARRPRARARDRDRRRRSRRSLDHELVSEIRAGLGAVAAVQIDPALLADDPGLTDRVTLAGPRPRRPHAHAHRRRPADLAAARDHARRAGRARRRARAARSTTSPRPAEPSHARAQLPRSFHLSRGTWSIASIAIPVVIFDAPMRRSEKRIGISTTSNPARIAR